MRADTLRAAAAALLFGLAACEDSPSGPNDDVAQLRVTPDESTLLAGDTITLGSAASSASGSGVDGARVEWASLDTAVATVSPAGMVTARAAGVARVVASAGSAADTALVRVMVPGPGGAPYFSMGRDHGCYLDQAGRALCWGENQRGQLGNGTRTPSGVPVPVSGGLAFVAIAAGHELTCAITAAGAAYCWGMNAAGQLGDGTRTDRSTPVRAVSFVELTSIASGVQTCGVTRARGLFCWGPGYVSGAAASQMASSAEELGTNVAAVAVGALHTCALRTTGEALCSGWNNQGQFGNPTAPEQPGGWYPVLGGRRFVSIAIGQFGYGACGITAGGAAYCWGDNIAGSLGTGGRSGRGGAVPLDGEPLMRTAVPGYTHGCGVARDGSTLCWGRNTRGELGDGTWRDRSAPVKVQGDVRFESVLPSTRGVTCGITADRALYCWGTSEGHTGVPVSPSSGPSPAALPGVPSTLALGRQHGCALVSGAVHCWGEGSLGRLGNGSTDNQLRPVRVSAAAPLTALSVGLEHSCALTGDGTAYCWGANYNGGLGDGTTEARALPTPVATPARFTSIAAGENHSCALTAAGEAHCWGRPALGATGRVTTSGDPAPVNTPLRFASLVAGSNHTCALTESGAAYCWGDDQFGQLGTRLNTGTCGGGKFEVPTSCSAAPVPVDGGLRFTRLSAGAALTCGITAEGAAYCWGGIAGNAGEIGNGTGAGSEVPAAVAGGHQFIQIAAGGRNFTGTSAACGITSRLQLLCWGGNAENRIALGPVERSNVPAPAGGVDAPTLIALGTRHGCAASDRGTVCWGFRGYGLLGDGSWAGSTVPLRVSPA